jgi:hypothetical protein
MIRYVRDFPQSLINIEYRFPTDDNILCATRVDKNSPFPTDWRLLGCALTHVAFAFLCPARLLVGDTGFSGGSTISGAVVGRGRDGPATHSSQ